MKVFQILRLHFTRWKLERYSTSWAVCRFLIWLFKTHRTWPRSGRVMFFSAFFICVGIRKSEHHNSESAKKYYRKVQRAPEAPLYSRVLKLGSCGFHWKVIHCLYILQLKFGEEFGEIPFGVGHKLELVFGFATLYLGNETR